jgi:VWFA-related protein
MLRACLSAAALVAWTSASAFAQQSDATFRSGIDLVRMDVRVTEANGSPVKDLRPDELQVDEGGRRADILFFQHVQEPAGPYDVAARTTSESEVSTNRGAPRGHLYVLIFDQQHITAGNEQRARLAAQRFLEQRMRPGDRVAIFALPGPGPELRFTGDVATAVRELPKVRGGLERTDLTGVGAIGVNEAYYIVRGDQTALSRVLLRLSTESGSTEVFGGTPQGRRENADSASETSIFARAVKENARTIVAKADGEARRFLILLTRLMREMKTIDGRKSVVVFSEGFFADHVANELEDAAAAAAQSYSVVYAMDLNRRGPSPSDASPRGGDAQREEQSRLEPLGTLAAETDGRLYIDASSRLERVLASVADESQDYYIVGFAPSPQALKDRGKYRRVKIRVARAGLQVSARSGYALDPTQPTPADRRRTINIAFASPFPEQRFPVETTTYVMRGSAVGTAKVVLAVAAEIPPPPDGTTAFVDVVFAVQESLTRQVVSSGTDRVAAPHRDRISEVRALVTHRVHFEAPPGDYVARVVVREPGGLAASVDRRFVVRELDGPGVTTSDLVIGSRRDPVPVRLRSSAGDALTGVLELYGHPAELRDVGVRVDLIAVDGDTVIRIGRATLLGIDESERGAARMALVELPLAGVLPGHYIVRAEVTSARGRLSGLRREFEVVTPSDDQ